MFAYLISSIRDPFLAATMTGYTMDFHGFDITTGYTLVLSGVCLFVVWKVLHYGMRPKDYPPGQTYIRSMVYVFDE